jgi:hypothetical protein
LFSTFKNKSTSDDFVFGSYEFIIWCIAVGVLVAGEGDGGLGHGGGDGGLGTDFGDDDAPAPAPDVRGVCGLGTVSEMMSLPLPLMMEEFVVLEQIS